MKRILLALALCLFSVPAWAVCAVTNLQVKDNAAVTAAVPYADDGSGASNCAPQVQLKQGGNVAGVLGSGADGVSNSTGGLAGYYFGMLYNGTTWDRWKGDATNGAFVNIKAMGGTAINSGCVGALNGFSSTTPATVCGVFGSYVLNANTNVNTTSDGVAAASAWGSPVVGENYIFNGTSWDRQQYPFTSNNASTRPEVCGSYATLSMSTATTTQIVALSGSTNIRICDFEISANAATNITFKSGTGSNCGTGTAQVGQTWYATANWAKAAANSFYRGLNAGASNALCVTSSQAVAVDIGVYYDRF